ncbi:MAG: [protein-PII] uridylyltransferase [Thiomargarita sp.]|nr:[protein-PII] uridylyltransferase [Thiomargarita sp.]
MYIDIELFNPEQFEKDLKANNLNKLSVFRQVLEQGHHTLKERFEAHKNAIHYVTQRAWLIDQVVLQVWREHASDFDFNTTALIAVGGYGRGELHPYSDIDLLILLESPIEDMAPIERFLTCLWDIKLEIGHSVRTLKECEEDAVADITIATNLTEVRLLNGSERLFQAMQAAVSPRHVWANKTFFSAKIEEQKQRYSKYDNTAYNLEPNIKESPGGLRDIQTVGWVAKRHFGAKTLQDLQQHGFLTEEEYQSLLEGQEFLWKIRCLLHLDAKRHEDRLLFNYQQSIATALDYKDDEAGLGVEKMMKQYYRTVGEISTLNDMLLQLFKEAILHAGTPSTIYSLNKRFQVRNKFIEVTYDKVFLHYPFALLEIFLLMQEHPEIKGIRATTIRLILHYKYLIDEVFRKDLRARSVFFEIFRQTEGLTHALRRMNSYGLLAAYIPTFGSIVGQMQHDLFHVYTVDQHTLFVISNLRCFTLPEFQDDFPFCSKLMETIPKPELLNLAGFFHDIAKGRGGKHSELGEKDALEICLIHGLSDNDARFVGWLVRNHLLMSDTTQRQDISDPDVIKAFAMNVIDVVHLDYLYLLTVADIRATNPKLWNDWKNTLLTTLYHRTVAFLRHENGQISDKQLHLLSTRKEARRLLNCSENKKINTLWKELGDDYFLCSSPKDVARETDAILNLIAPDNTLVLERPDTKGGTQFIIYTPDRDYLFAEITCFLEQENLTIVEAYIIPTQNEYTFNSYTVLEENGKAISDIRRVDHILQGIKKAIIHNKSTTFSPIVCHIPREIKHFSIQTRVTFTQDTGDNHTVIKVVTTDRSGILSRIAQAFLTCQVRVKNAKIVTLGERVEDIFFVTDYENHALYSADQLRCLRKELSQLLDKDINAN